MSVLSRILLCAVFSYAAIAALAQAAPSDPVTIESIWTDSNRKYDTPRAAILKEVDRQIHAGPFRPDWESLQQYQDPLSH
jgi:alpha-L-fucosidase